MKAHALPWLAAWLLATAIDAGAASLNAGDANGLPGETVAISLSLVDSTDPVQVLSLQGAIGFDPGVFTLLDIVPGAAAGVVPVGSFYSPDELDDGVPRTFLLSVVLTSPVVLPPELLVVHFLIDPAAATGDYAISLANVELDDVPLAAVGGTLSVTAVPVPAPAFLAAACAAGLLCAPCRRRAGVEERSSAGSAAA